MRLRWCFVACLLLASCKTLVSLNTYVQHRVEGSAGRRLPVEERPCRAAGWSPYEFARPGGAYSSYLSLA